MKILRYTVKKDKKQCGKRFCLESKFMRVMRRKSGYSTVKLADKSYANLNSCHCHFLNFDTDKFTVWSRSCIEASKPHVRLHFHNPIIPSLQLFPYISEERHFNNIRNDDRLSHTEDNEPEN